MVKDKNIPQWQKSVFGSSVDKTSCVKTKPISTSSIKKIEKDFFDQNHQKIKIINPELYQVYKKEFSNKKKSKITKNNIKENNIRETSLKDKVNQKLSDVKIILDKDFFDQNQSSSLNKDKTKSDDELTNYLEQKKLERKIEIEQLRKEEQDLKIKFENVRKDLNCGMGFVDPYSAINQNILGHSQSWRFKAKKKYRYYD